MLSTVRDFWIRFCGMTYVFCCPPWPSKIASKLAFFPPKPNYILTEKSEGNYKINLLAEEEWQIPVSEGNKMNCFFTTTSKKNKVVCMYIRCTAHPRYTILYSHGNAVDLGDMCRFYLGLGTRLNCNVFSYDYSGYGQSSGKPSEKNLYADVEAAWKALQRLYPAEGRRVILYGQSLGSVAAVDLASRLAGSDGPAGVVLHSPLASALRVPFPGMSRSCPFDPFPSIEKISRISCPVLVIHGTADDLIDLSHGLALYARCRHPLEPLWLEGAGHNDIEFYWQYLERLKRLVAGELSTPNLQHPSLLQHSLNKI